MNRTLFQYHPTYGFRFVPGVRARVPHEGGGYLVRANSAGFRSDREFVAARSPGTRRALLFGDSYTAGDGVSNGARYSDIVERSVAGLEVYNYGLPGTGPDQHYLVYRDVADRVEHDLVIIAVLVENVRRVVARYRVFEDAEGKHVAVAKPYFTLDGNETIALHNVPVPPTPVALDSLPASERQHVDHGGDRALMRKALNLLGPTVKALVQGAVGQNPLPAYDSPNDPGWRVLRAVLARWIAESPTPVLLMPLPLYHYVEGIADPSAYQARFSELAQATGAYLHDPLPALAALSPQERRKLRFERDVHPTPFAHERLAQSLTAAVTRLFGSPAPVAV
jgi:carbamoyltransferase